MHFLLLLKICPLYFSEQAFCQTSSPLFCMILCLPVNLRIEDQFLAWPWMAHWTSLWVHFISSLLLEIVISQFLVGATVLFLSRILHTLLFQYGSHLVPHPTTKGWTSVSVSKMMSLRKFFRTSRSCWTSH